MKIRFSISATILALLVQFVLIPPANASSTHGKKCTIVGTPGDDTLTGTEKSDVICGLEGNDTIRGLAGNDVLDGGLGDDIIFGDSGDDKIYGDAGADEITAGAGNDIISGGIGDDRVTAGDGSDLVATQGGNDEIDGGSGNDRIDSGSGSDMVNAGIGIDACVNEASDSASNCEAQIEVISSKGIILAGTLLTKTGKKIPGISIQTNPGLDGGARTRSNTDGSFGFISPSGKKFIGISGGCVSSSTADCSSWSSLNLPQNFTIQLGKGSWRKMNLSNDMKRTIRLPETVKITVRAVNSFGEPIEGVSVSQASGTGIYDWSFPGAGAKCFGNSYNEAVTDANGRATLWVFKGASHFIEFTYRDSGSGQTFNQNVTIGKISKSTTVTFRN